jgi:hypothetical protein
MLNELASSPMDTATSSLTLTLTTSASEESS